MYWPATYTRWPSSSRVSGLAAVRLRRLWLLALASGLGLAGIASANSLPLSSATIGTAASVIGACDTGGVEWRYAIDAAGMVTSATVRDIDLACSGATLRLTLTGGGAIVGAGSAVLPSAGFDGEATLNISPTPQSSAVERAYVAIDGG